MMTDDLDQRLETWRMNFQSQIAAWNYSRQNFLEMNRSASDFSLMAVRSLILINGAAVVAILAFAAQIWSPQSGAPSVAKELLGATEEFAIGLAAAVVCAVLGYVTMYFYAWAANDEKNPRFPTLVWIGRAVHILAVSTAIYSMVRFWWGVEIAALALGR